MPAVQHRYVFDDGRLKSLLAQSLTYDPVRVPGSPTVRLSLVAVNADRYVGGLGSHVPKNIKNFEGFDGEI
jgi:hypothetical protein